MSSNLILYSMESNMAVIDLKSDDPSNLGPNHLSTSLMVDLFKNLSTYHYLKEIFHQDL